MLSGAFGWTHWLIIIAILVVLFGANRLPSAARGLGRSMRILKSEMHDEDTAPGTETRTSADTERGRS